MRVLYFYMVVCVSIIGCAKPLCNLRSLDLPWKIDKFGSVSRQDYTPDKMQNWLYHIDLAKEFHRTSQKFFQQSLTALAPFIPNPKKDANELKKAVEQLRLKEHSNIPQDQADKISKDWALAIQADVYALYSGVIIAEIKQKFLDSENCFESLRQKIEELPTIESIEKLRENISNANKAYRQLQIVNEDRIRIPFPDEVREKDIHFADTP